MFKSKLRTETARETWVEYDRLLANNDIDGAIVSLEKLYKNAASEMIVKNGKRRYAKKKVPWWDEDLNKIKRSRNAALRKYRTNKKENDLNEYVKRRKRLREVFKIKEKQYKGGLYEKLKACKNNSKEFWQFVNEGDKKSAGKCTITNEQ